MHFATQQGSVEGRSIHTSNRPSPRILVSFAFWIIFTLNYLYMDRLITVVTNGKFRLGIVVLVLCLLVIVFYQKVLKNIILASAIFFLSGIAIISAWINHIGFVQLLAFIRIPLIVYLIYNLVSSYLLTVERAEKVLRIMMVIAAFQLPIIAVQRVAYPWLPERFKLTTSLVDFGMGTFGGDTSMAFALVGLIIILLFDHRVAKIVKQRWLLAGWLSLTVLFSNSQIQHVTIVLIWFAYMLIHLRAKTIIMVSMLIILIAGLLVGLSQSNLMTFPLLQNTIRKITQVSNVFEGDVNYDVFLEGRHARDAAIAYYLGQPIKWIGDGPGTAYDTSTGERSVGGWGHIFNFYAEVGLIGLLLSWLIFFIIAFPINLGSSRLRISISWTSALIFLAVLVVTLVKEPMGNTAFIFTYCILLKGHRVLTARKMPEEQVPGNHWSVNSSYQI